MPKQKKMWDNILTVIMTLLSLLWIYPIVLILLNSLKVEGSFTTSTVFKLPTAETFAGLSNYVYGVTKMGFLSSLGYSLVITVTSVALILLCCSMTGWYLTRVNNKLSKFMNLLIVFSMVVPFQMVMFTLSKTADQLNLNTPWNICIIYLGFGAGLAVFMFTGFMKSVPMEIEEAAMIDGCNPIQIFFKVVFPILKPTMISTAILETMWVWNDYLLPTLVLEMGQGHDIHRSFGNQIVDGIFHIMSEIDHVGLWNRCLEIIRDNVPEQTYKTWFLPIVPLKYEDHDSHNVPYPD